MFLLKKQAEYLASDLLHLIPTGIFNALGEAISPTFPDILFLIPIGLTDGIIGGIIGLILGGYLRNKSQVIIYTFLIISFAIFEFVDVKFIPLFTP
jgi:phosphate/sulfate permease